MGILLFLVALVLAQSTARVSGIPLLNNQQEAESKRDPKTGVLSAVESNIDRLLDGVEHKDRRELMSERTQIPSSDGTGVADEASQTDQWNRLFKKYIRKAWEIDSGLKEEHKREKNKETICDWKRAFTRFASGWSRDSIPGKAELAEWANVFKRLYGQESKRGCTHHESEALSQRTLENDKDQRVYDSDDDLVRSLMEGETEAKREGPTSFGTGWAHANVLHRQNNHLLQWEKMYQELFGKKQDKRGGAGLFSSGWAHGTPTKPNHAAQWERLFEEMYGRKYASKRSDDLLPADWLRESEDSKADDSREMIGKMFGAHSVPLQGNQVNPVPETSKRDGVFSSGWAHGQKGRSNKHMDEWNSLYKNMFGRMQRRSRQDSQDSFLKK